MCEERWPSGLRYGFGKAAWGNSPWVRIPPFPQIISNPIKVFSMFKKFDENSQGGSFQRQMFDVSNLNIKCRDCETPITQLPSE